MPESKPTIANLSMLVARLIQRVRKHDPKDDVAEKAMDYLRRTDLAGSVLREVTVRFSTDEQKISGRNVTDLHLWAEDELHALAVALIDEAEKRKENTK